VRMTSIFSAGTLYTVRSNSRAFSAMTMTFNEASMIPLRTLRCTVSVQQGRCEGADDRMVSRASNAKM